MINLRITEEEKKDQASHSVLYDTPEYPYGLKLQIDPETYAKLGLKDAPQIGQKLILLAAVEVCGGYEEDQKGDVKGYSMTLQIEQMELKAASQSQQAEDVLYSKG